MGNSEKFYGADCKNVIGVGVAIEEIYLCDTIQYSRNLIITFSWLCYHIHQNLNDRFGLFVCQTNYDNKQNLCEYEMYTAHITEIIVNGKGK